MSNNFYLWSPIYFILGIIIYFSLSSEPNIYTLIEINLLLLFACFLNYGKSAASLCHIIICIFGAILISSINTKTHSKTLLNKNTSIFDAIGIIDDITYNNKKTILNLTAVQHKKAFKNLKITINKQINEELLIGQKIKFSALLIPFNENILPHDYNESFYNYFNNIDAKGFLIGKLQIIDNAHRYKYFTNKIRNNLERKINDLYDNNKITNNGLITALVIGKKNQIPPEIIKQFRLSGISHLLAISGLHLAIFSGWIFLISRFLLVAIFPRFFISYDSQIIAACIGIIVGFLYLQISGASFSTQRSFIMVTILYLSMILQKNYFNKNALVTAANIILLLKPAAIFSPSFQMSFIGVIAIYCSSNINNKLYINNAIWRWISMSMTTSILATLFTAPYSIWNFHTVNFSGLITNLIAIPLMSVIIMPLIIIFLIIIKLSFAKYLLLIINFFLQILVKIASLISHIPYLNYENLTIKFLTLILITYFIIQLFINEKYRINILFLALISCFSTQQNPQALIYNKNIYFLDSKNNLLSIHNSRRTKTTNKIEKFFQSHLIKNNKGVLGIDEFSYVTNYNYFIDCENYLIKDKKKHILMNYLHKKSYVMYCNKKKCSIKPVNKNRPWTIKF